MGYKIRLTFVYSQSFLLRFLQYYPLQLPKAAIFPPRDANCKRSNRRIQSLPFCFQALQFSLIVDQELSKTKIPSFRSHEPEKSARKTKDQRADQEKRKQAIKLLTCIDAHRVPAWATNQGGVSMFQTKTGGEGRSTAPVPGSLLILIKININKKPQLTKTSKSTAFL